MIVIICFIMFAMTEKNTMEYSGKANGMLKYRLYMELVMTLSLQYCYLCLCIRILRHYQSKFIIRYIQ
jgi:hypothetical protein